MKLLTVVGLSFHPVCFFYLSRLDELLMMISYFPKSFRLLNSFLFRLLRVLLQDLDLTGDGQVLSVAGYSPLFLFVSFFSPVLMFIFVKSAVSMTSEGFSTILIGEGSFLIFNY